MSDKEDFADKCFAEKEDFADNEDSTEYETFIDEFAEDITKSMSPDDDCN
jgi:hypothetical protein